MHELNWFKFNSEKVVQCLGKNHNAKKTGGGEQNSNAKVKAGD